MKMKVFAEFISEKGIQYRRNTLLQFGNSWDLIGSAVLKNPGSAKPNGQVSREIFEDINRFFDNQSLIHKNWFNFKDDPTMGFIEKLFNGYYLNRESQLAGVIQLFNLYYVRDQNIVNARSKLDKGNSHYQYIDSKEIIPMFKNRPVFLGWFKEYKVNQEIWNNANKLFDYVVNSEFNYLNPKMDDNNFYHPMRINMYYKGKDIQESINAFHNMV